MIDTIYVIAFSRKMDHLQIQNHILAAERERNSGQEIFMEDFQEFCFRTAGDISYVLTFI